tara:strand:- start:400 stop:675 length:276 start_codon:yes stop_codon:yes gene_type:complete
MVEIEKLETGEDLYIECNAVDDDGNILEKDPDATNENTFSFLKNDINLELSNNIGVQALIGASLMIMVYVMADYVFKALPNKKINDHINGI